MDIAERNRTVVEQFRAGGPVSGMDRDRLLLLTTTGRRSGRPHTTPMMFHRGRDRLVVIASNNGAPQHPHWYLNLVADPRVEVEIGDRHYPARAVSAEGDDRAQLWNELAGAYPFFRDHQARAGRTIPLIALSETSR